MRRVVIIVILLAPWGLASFPSCCFALYDYSIAKDYWSNAPMREVDRAVDRGDVYAFDEMKMRIGRRLESNSILQVAMEYQSLYNKIRRNSIGEGIRKSCTPPDDGLLFFYSYLCRLAEGAKVDRSEAFYCIFNAAGRGDASAQSVLGSIYKRGILVPVDYEKALQWYRKAAAQDFRLAMIALGYMYANGQGLSKDDDEAISWYIKASQKSTAFVLDKTDGNVLSIDKVAIHQRLAWFRKLADNDNVYAQYILGDIYDSGGKIPRDTNEAIMWYERAAKGGYALAQRALGLLMYDLYYSDPKIDRQNPICLPENAITYLKKAAEQGDSEASLALAERDMYDSKPKWMYLSANQSNVTAQANMGDAYYRYYYYRAYGRENAYNPGAYCIINTNDDLMTWLDLSVKYLRPAAYRGSRRAIELLAAIVCEEKYSKLDQSEMAEIVYYSAYAGYVPAQYLLGSYYMDGAGLARDNVEAYKWFVIASKLEADYLDNISSKTNEYSISLAPCVIAGRQRMNKLANTLAASGIDEAKRMAMAYLAVNPDYQKRIKETGPVLQASGPVVQTDGAGLEWQILNEEAMNLYKEKQYEAAEKLARKTLEISSNAVGKEHPDVATSLVTLAMIYGAQQKKELSEPLYKRALEIRRSLFGDDDPHIAFILEQLKYVGENSNGK